MNSKAATVGGVLVGFIIGGAAFWYAAKHPRDKMPKWSHDIVATVDAKHQGEANDGYLMLYYACTKPSVTPNGLQKITYGFAEYDVNLVTGEFKFIKGLRPQDTFRCPE